MNIRALRLPILFTGFILSVLVSLSAFSLSAHAEVAYPEDFPWTYATTSHAYNYFYDYIIVNVNSGSQDSFLGGFLLLSSGQYKVELIFTERVSGSYTYRSSGPSSSSPVTKSFGTFKTIVVDGVTYYYLDGVATSVVASSNVSPLTEYSYTDLSSGIRELLTPRGPEFADFGFNNISYTTYLPPNNSLLFEQYHFDSLSYFFTWQGSTNPDFPITSFNYELYGFLDTGMSNTDKSNGELVDSGSHSVPNVFSYEPPYGSLLDIWGALKYDKVILYLTPFSNTTEGNTFYVVLNVVRGVGFEVNLGPLGSIDFGSSVRDVQIGDGVLPVPQTDALLIEDNKYMPVGYIDQVPVIYAIKTTSGSYNRHIDIYHENISYAPVVYGDTEYITNNDNSKVTNNNQSYNVIINNINGSVNLDPDGSGYADSIVSFLSLIVVFFQTCWTYFIQGFLFFPQWVPNLISGLIGLLATIVAALAVLKIMRGIL